MRIFLSSCAIVIIIMHTYIHTLYNVEKKPLSQKNGRFFGILFLCVPKMFLRTIELFFILRSASELLLRTLIWHYDIRSIEITKKKTHNVQLSKQFISMSQYWKISLHNFGLVFDIYSSINVMTTMTFWFVKWKSLPHSFETKWNLCKSSLHASPMPLFI